MEFTEHFFNGVDFTEVEDQKTGTVRMKVLGVVQEADVINSNKRIYSREVLEDAVDNLIPLVKARKVFGEVDHPLIRGSLKDTSHLVTNLWWSEEKGKQNQLIAEFTVLNTENGVAIKEILRAGGRPGFSSRGQGKSTHIKIDGKGDVEKIEPGFRFDSFDFVINPSVKSAQIQKIIEENFKDKKGEISEYEIKIRLQRQAGIRVTTEKKVEHENLTPVERNIRRLAGLP